MNTKDIEEIEQILYAPNLNITQQEYRAFIEEVVPKILTTLTQHHEAEVERVRKEAWAIGYAQCEADNNLLPTVNVDYSKLTPTTPDNQPNITSDK